MLTLRRVWVSTVARFVGVIVAVMLASLGTLQYQRSASSDTMADLEATTESQVVLDRAVHEATIPMVPMIYRSGDDAKVEAATEAYAVARLEVERAFDAAADIADTPAVRESLAAARRTSQATHEMVIESVTLYTDEDLASLLRIGDDPFVPTLWPLFDTLNRDFAALREATVSDLQAQLAKAERAQSLILPVFVISLGVALGLAALAGRGMSRRVLRPLAAVERGAAMLSDTEVAMPIEVTGAVKEVQSLVDAINQAATQLRASHGMLQAQATTDSLTSLANRVAFGHHLDALLGSPLVARVAVLFIDLDDFKDVNDSLGHAGGDELLRIVGQRIRATTRADGFVARLGGDEFAIALAIGPEGDAAIGLADRILAVVGDPVRIGDVAIDVNCSIGVAFSDGAATTETADSLLSKADFAMYMAKSEGKSRYEVHSAAVHADVMARMGLRRDLGAALGNGELELHYQPVIELDTERLTGFEALLRWHHPRRGLIPPSEFIPLAEESGDIVGIGVWVIDQACAMLARLHLDHPDLAMNVNVAPKQLAASDFVSTVVAITRRHGVAPDCLALEVTEETAIANTGRAAQVLTELRAKGFHVALDDFGTGFSSLRYLGSLPADVIKIDRSFVAARGSREASMLESIISLAQRLGLHVVAEGIETSEDLDRLSGYGSLAGQGFLFARPMPESELLAYLSRGSWRSVAVTSGA